MQQKQNQMLKSWLWVTLGKLLNLSDLNFHMWNEASGSLFCKFLVKIKVSLHSMS